MEDRFRRKYKNFNSDIKINIDKIKELAEQLENEINKYELTREQSLALTKLEECIFWVVKSLTK